MVAGHNYAEEECNTCEVETTGYGIFVGDDFIYICGVCDEVTEHYRPKGD